MAVNCRKNGAEQVEYIGIFGDDENAQWIRACLAEEGVGFSRSRRVVRAVSQAESVFKGRRPGIWSRAEGELPAPLCLRIVPEDVELIRQFDVCHTSCYSNIEYELPALAAACKVSFDFSDKRDPEYLKRVCPHLTYAFFSGADLTLADCRALLERACGLGTKIAGVTRGKEGALFYDGSAFCSQGIKPANAVDTMGAGDSFIAGFLTRYEDTGKMGEALDYAAERAALSCGVRGGFGHPHPMNEN